MTKTFISFIGRGRPVAGQSAYQKTKYDFGNDVNCETSCFADAVRLCGKYMFDRVLFIGTPSSSWSALLENVPEETDFCLELLDRESEKYELDEVREKTLTESLCRVWGKPVCLLLNPPQLLEDNAEKIFDFYVRELLEAGDDILLDITHSFRWMPILLTSALSFKNAFPGCSSNIQIIYGELGEGKSISPVRCLDILVREQKIADAVSLFFQKFEPAPLAAMLEPYWREGAEAIRKLGMHIQGNLFLPLLFNCRQSGFQIGDPLKQLNNALKVFKADGQPVWVKRTAADLRSIYDNLTGGDPPARLCSLAELLAGRNLYAQAIMAVCLAAEQSLALAYRFDHTPAYHEIQDLKNRFCKQSKKQHLQKKQWVSDSSAKADGNPAVWLRKDIDEMRNLIAHGGFSNNRTNPSPEALPNQFRTALGRLRDLQVFLRENPPPFHAGKNNSKKMESEK